MTKFTEFLASVSGANRPSLTVSAYSLVEAVPGNHSYQQTLEAVFGDDESTSVTRMSIVDNKVLSFGARSLFLKIAAFATQAQCYDFLNHIYARVKADTPGYYWDLLLAIKRINDLCNNTTIFNSEASMRDALLFSSQISAGNKFFKYNREYLTDIRDPNLVRKALQYLIVQQIEKIGQEALQILGADGYKEQQTLEAAALDATEPNPRWLFLCSEVTTRQIDADPTARVINAKLTVAKKVYADALLDVTGHADHFFLCPVVTEAQSIVEAPAAQFFNEHATQQESSDTARSKRELESIAAPAATAGPKLGRA